MANKYGCGIYLITNIANGKVYVGQSVAVTRRWDMHKSCLRRGIHQNLHLQRSWDKHGEKSFRFELVEDTERTRSALQVAEQRWMDRLNPAFNIAPAAGSTAGLPMHPNTRAALARALKGRVLSEEARRKIGDANRHLLLGHKQSEATKEKRAASQRGRHNPGGLKLRGRKRPQHVIDALKASNELRWAANVARIRAAIAETPDASTTAIAKRIKADWTTVKKYQKEYALARSVQR